MTKREGYRLEQTATLQLQKVTASQDDRGKEKREHGQLQKETKCIGPSLRAIKPGLGNTVQALAQDDKRGREIGRASCRERVEISVGDVSLKRKHVRSGG